MHIYQPYEVLADTPDTLHLIETETRQWIQFVMFRIFPIALLFTGWVTLRQTGSEIPMGFNYLIAIIVLVFALLLLLRPYTTEIKIAAGNIFMIRKTFFGSGKVNIAVADIQNITLFVRRGKGGKASFNLYLKNKKSYEILSIPMLWMKENNLTAICTVLEQLTRIAVKRM